MRRIALALACLLIAAGAPARAFHDPALPLVAEGGTERAGWVAHRVVLDGDEFELDISAAVHTSYLTGGVFLDGDGAALGWFWIIGTPGKEGVTVEVRLPVAAVDVHRMEPGTFGGARAGTSLLFNCATCPKISGTFTFVLWMSGDVRDLAWAVRARETVGEVHTTTGNEAFLYRSHDFTGSANVQAYPGGVGARANARTSVTQRIERALFGFYAPFANANVMTVDTPSGARLCTEAGPESVWPSCNFVSARDGERAGPGEYRFHVTGAGAGIAGTAEVFAGGADVLLP